MSVNPTPPRGMRDFIPSEKRKREAFLRIIRERFAVHGFDEIETPALENIAVLHSGTGGDNEKLSFSVLKRGIGADDFTRAAQTGDPLALADLGLRFDLTVPLSRFYAANRSELPTVFRSLHIAPVWRAERPQKGRFRQFMQCDIDIIGSCSHLAEAELISATSDVLQALGLRECTIRINDRRILTGLLHFCGFAPERHPQALITLDKLDKIGLEAVVSELDNYGSDAAEVLGGILEELMPHLSDGGVPLNADAIAGVLPAGIDPDAVIALETLSHSLDTVPETVRVRFDPTLVRGMGYYTGTIFEIMHPASGSSIGGGGRYDDMIGRLTGSPVPAAGFSLGFERIIDLLDEPATPAPEALVLVHDDTVALPHLMRIKTELVAQGKRVRLERRTKNMAAVLDRASALGYTGFASVSSQDTSSATLSYKPLNG